MCGDKEGGKVWDGVLLLWRGRGVSNTDRECRKIGWLLGWDRLG